MSSLRQAEATGMGVRRIACAKVEQAIRCLTRQPGQGAEAVALIRSAHAMLALIEPDLPKPVTKRDRAILGRLIDGLDDLATPDLLLSRLETHHKKTPADPALAEAVKALRKRWSGQKTRPGLALNSKAGSFNPAIYRLVADMAELRGYAETWPVDDLPDDAPPRGLRRTYTRARRLAGQPTTAGALGELLACLNLLAEQLNVMTKANPPMVKAQRKLITRAADGFEQLHRDDQLNHAIQKQLGQRPSAKPKDARALSEDAARDLTHALAETPAAFMNRLGVYWSVWKRESEGG